MKSITYISKVVARQNGALIPVGLSSILRTARKTNAELNITGIMSYRNGHYIQVLEGGDRAVDQIFSKIATDSRHEQVTMLFESQISERAFPNWTMKLVESVDKDTNFLDFITNNGDQVSNLDANSRELLTHFHKPTNNKSRAIQKYDGRSVKLSAWPDFSSVPPTPIVVELCARLTKRPHSYSSLLNSGEFGTKRQLDKILDAFNTHEILVLADNEYPSNDASNTAKPNNFYSKMKNLLRLRK